MKLNTEVKVDEWIHEIDSRAVERGRGCWYKINENLNFYGMLLYKKNAVK